MIYVPRGLEPRLLEALSVSPVVVLEGARAVGKSTMCDKLVEQGALAVRALLTDPQTYDHASRDLRGWLASLPVPAVIDEAQLIEDLPVAVKDLVDRADRRRQFVLTGSVSLGRRGLGGSDPLAGRAMRLCLRPLTQLEMGTTGLLASRAARASIVDDMFAGCPRTGGAGRPLSRDQLAGKMARGGFPLRAVGDRAAVANRLHRNQVEADVEAALVEVRMGDERFDVFLARRTLDAVAGVPAGILNVSKLAGELQVARHTVDTYLGHLERRFLIHRLANIGARPRSQGVGTARSKVHPVDTALSIGILNRMGHQFRSNAELYGALFESFVVNDLIAQAGWSEVYPEVGYWRDTGKRGDAEVDLVLADGENRIVGVEVKSSGSVRSDDARGLLALRAAKGLHRGFVVYQGSDVVELGESIWALPIGALSDPGRWEKPVGINSRRSLTEVDPDVVPPPASRVSDSLSDDAAPTAATVFVSYVHADDQHENGAIRGFVERLADTYEFLFGESLEIFIDRDIRWGESWQPRLNAELERTTFLLAVVTPRFLNSRQCRDEVMTFSAAVRGLGQPRLVLPLIWREPPQLRDGTTGDLLIERLREAQWEDVGELRLADPASAGYRQQLEKLAERLDDTIQAVDRQQRLSSEEAHGPVTAAVDDDGAEDQRDLIDLAIDAEDGAEGVVRAFVELTAAVQELGLDMEGLGAPMGPSSPRVLRAWAGRAAETLESPTSRLEEATASVRSAWGNLDGVMTKILRMVDNLPPGQPRPEDLFSQIADLHDAFSQLADNPQLADLRVTMQSVAAMTRRLRPVARAVGSAVDLMSEVRASAAAWLQLLEPRGGHV